MLGAVCVVKAQDTLTPLLVREVYDFQVGDVFQYTHEVSRYTPNLLKHTTYTQVVIVAKNQLPHQIIYTKEIREKDIDSKITKRIENDTLLNLDSSIFVVLKSLLPPEENQSDYIETNQVLHHNAFYGAGKYCDNRVNTKILKSGSLGFKREFMKNLGMTEWIYNDRFYPADQSGVYYFNYLSFYRRGEKVYGIPDDFTIANKETYLANDIIRVFPNPINGDRVYFSGLDIENANNNPVYHIYNTLGNKLYSGKLNNNILEISAMQLVKGIYFIQIIEGKEIITTQKICIN
jgi:hypothetical protein